MGTWELNAQVRNAMDCWEKETQLKENNYILTWYFSKSDHCSIRSEASDL